MPRLNRDRGLGGFLRILLVGRLFKSSMEELTTQVGTSYLAEAPSACLQHPPTDLKNC